MTESRLPPPPAQFACLRPTAFMGLAHCTANLGVFALGIWLSWDGGPGRWLAGQALLGFAILHAFVLLHEAGHGTLFRQRGLNVVAGHVAGFLALIPFRNWQRIHARHHRYTGWQDLDATTAALVPRELASWERILVNVAWSTWLPLFALSYRIQNFWNLPRIAQFIRRPRDLRLMRWNVVLLLAIYLSVLAFLGPAKTFQLFGLAVFLSLMAQEPLILSQHTHVPQRLSGGADIRPYPPEEQERFTRSLRLPGWLSAALLHFDAHELHHIYPQVPGYRLRQVSYAPCHEVNWFRWLLTARRMQGTTFLFSNWDRTGIRV